MSKITKKQFIADVMHEIEMLKKHATPEEIAKLDFSTFDANEIDGCIYGQLTGACNDDRSIELIKACCLKSINFFPSNLRTKIRDLSIEDILPNVSAPKQAIKKDSWNERSLDYISALEGYIYSKGANCEGIIAYLKGETNTLTL
jgi:hypothetical protein